MKEANRVSRHFSRKIKRAAFERCGGRCDGCAAILTTGRIVYDHRIPWEISRDSSLVNCQVLCIACDRVKTPGDISVIRKSDRIRDRHIGAMQADRPLPCGRKSRLTKPLHGAPRRRLTLGQKLEQLNQRKGTNHVRRS